MATYFDRLDKNFGFGCMRLPMIGSDVDMEQTKEMVDAFLNAGFCYFDTAHGYIDGKSELAVRECLTSRYPRERYILTNKLSGNYFKTQEDIRPLFQQQLEACGVEYFDFYLMHAQSSRNIDHYRQCRAYETALELKAEGKIHHLGLSFHDSAEFLDSLLTEHPEVEVVQIQFNYLDYESDSVQSRKCYEVCRKHGKPVIVMEPVKGGSLVNLPASAQRIYDQLGSCSNAGYAIRFAAGFEGMMMVLSGMSSLEQMEDNIRSMEHFQPLSGAESQAVEQVASILRNQGLVSCTGCRYCTEVCPQGIAIPDLFAALNAKRQGQPGEAGDVLPFQCVKCGSCEQICPQELPIRDLLVTAAAELA